MGSCKVHPWLYICELLGLIYGKNTSLNFNEFINWRSVNLKKNGKQQFDKQ